MATDSNNVLVNTRYVKPGVFIGRIIRPAPISGGFVRTVNMVAKGNRLQTVFNAPIRRSYRVESPLNFSPTAPHIAPLTAPANNDQQISLVQKGNGVIVPTTKWKFTESVAGSNVFDQILLLPEAYESSTSYTTDYQSLSRSVKDDLPFSNLREVRSIGDTEDQSQYVEGENHRILMSVTAPSADTANANTTSEFTPVTQIAGNGTGSVSITVGSNFTGTYNRTYTLRATLISAGTITFNWECVTISGGNNLQPNVPINPTSPLPSFDVPQGAITTVSLSHALLGGDLGVNVTIDDSTSTISQGPVGDTFQFTAMGPGVMELDERYTNTNQFSQIDPPVATLQPGSTGVLTLHDPTEYTGEQNRTYMLEVASVAGVSPLREATVVWQGFGQGPVTFGTLTIKEALGSNLDIQIEQGVVLDANFGLTHFVVGDLFQVDTFAPRTQPFIKDDRNYELSVTSSAAGSASLFYSGSTQEAGFGISSIIPDVASTYQWSTAMAVDYATPTEGKFTIPGDYLMFARNIGIDVAHNRHVAGDKHTFSSTDLLQVDWTLASRVVETFDVTQIFTDTLGSITGTAGQKYIILNNIPEDIIYVHNSPAETSLSYTQVAGLPYIAFPGAPSGAVSVRYQFRGAEPDPGNLYYVTANILRPSTKYNTSILYPTIDDARRDLGPSAPDNDALIGAEICFENDAPQIRVTQVEDTDSDGIFTKFDYEAAIEATERDADTTDIVVLNSFDSLSKQLASNVAMNDPFSRKERMLWVGAPANTAIGDTQTPDTLVSLAMVTMQVFGDSQAHGRRVLLGQTWATKTILLTDSSQLTVNLDGSFVALAAAAKNASFTDPGTTLLRTTLAGFDSIQDYNESEELQLGSASILYLTDLGAGVHRFEESVTVDRFSPDNNEISAQNQVLFVTRDVRSRMDSSLISLVPPSQQAGIAMVQVTLVGILTELVSRGQIAPYSNDDGTDRPLDPANDIQVFRDPTDKTHYNFKYFYNLRYPIKRMFGLFSVDRKLFGIVA